MNEISVSAAVDRPWRRAENSPVRRLLDAWAEALREVLAEGLVAAALFGSRARGDERLDSDWDVLVLVRSEPDDALALVADLRRACGRRTAVTPTLMLRSQAAFEREFPAFYLDLAADAWVFDGAHYLAPRLARIRELTQAAGLRRVRRRGLWSWEWFRPPPGHWALDWSGYRDVA